MADIRLEFNAREFERRLRNEGEKVLEAGKRGVEDSVDELVRISSEITPIDKGVLQKSHSTDINKNASGIEGKVEYAVREANSGGHFNYALWIHEGEYELGEESKRRHGTSGWSGKSYKVGNKYLERPVKGEEKAIVKHIADEIKREIGG